MKQTKLTTDLNEYFLLRSLHQGNVAQRSQIGLHSKDNQIKHRHWNSIMSKRFRHS
jgi:hypothetical protein